MENGLSLGSIVVGVVVLATLELVALAATQEGEGGPAVGGASAGLACVVWVGAVVVATGTLVVAS